MAVAGRRFLTTNRFMFPWREGNRFEMLVDGDRFLPRMLKAIQEARAYILVELYLFESGTVADRFIEALIEAAGRGVAVKLLLDHFGVRGLSHYDKRRLTESNVEVLYYNPVRLKRWLRNLVRDHRKLLLVDGEIAFTGGAGLTDEFDPPGQPQQRWRECMVQIQGPVIADWLTLFSLTWEGSSRGPLDLPPPAPALLDQGMSGRVTSSSGLKRREIMRSLIRHIHNAEHRVWLQIAYFQPSWKLRRTLRYAARHGVDVRLLLPGPQTDHPAVRRAGHRYYSELLRLGVRIYEYQPRVLHSKVLLCDQWAAVGSANLDKWDLRWNLEANQEMDDQRFAHSVAQMFEADFKDSTEYDYEHWLQRSWTSRFWEWVWGLVERLLSSLKAK